MSDETRPMIGYQLNIDHRIDGLQGVFFQLILVFAVNPPFHVFQRVAQVRIKLRIEHNPGTAVHSGSSVVIERPRENLLADDPAVRPGKLVAVGEHGHFLEVKAGENFTGELCRICVL